MSKKQLYAQCGMRRKNVFRTSWIPQKFAKAGGVVKLKDNGKWSDGWIVESVGSVGKLPERINHRKATGDLLPKIK